ncbi:hypothetical protein FNF27_02330 [Cafeteria roenbergensis]|uniref:Protein kinase domain-containing protein n=3 Tax=Cafeteria roenbergensis TaxID=33653 RepID=A0A5A8DS50_CAFRO|nr:hypothetical protein FNF31_00607 [Cafeteria roenbergensis]KAA0169389.1 hypothetical protein FNF28_02169 [Cafeteria roenbergensis]KAA0176273.1 hypothetical protein FNF27_02330 [Cafeteria roenbergensis]
MGCTSSKADAYTLVVLASPTSKPLETLLNDRDAEGIRGHTSRIAAESGRYYFGRGDSGPESIFLDPSEIDMDSAVEIGAGGFGAVFASLHLPTGAVVAVKRIRKSREGRFRREIDQETKALAKLQGCPFVVKFYGRTETPTHECFVLQLLQGGELYSHLSRTPGKRFSESVTRFYAAELVTCLESLHARGMAYRDLKPENLCLDSDGHIALIDFGFCCPVDARGLARGYVGTPYFMSPEILDPRSKDMGYPAQAVDWWAMGCALWEMLAGSHPFGGPEMTKHEVFIKITHGRSHPPMRLSAEARSLLALLLTVDYKARLKTAAAIKQHPWFAGVPWEAIAERRVKPPWAPSLSGAADCKYFPRARGRNPRVPDMPPGPMSAQSQGSAGTAAGGSTSLSTGRTGQAAGAGLAVSARAGASSAPSTTSAPVAMTVEETMGTDPEQTGRSRQQAAAARRRHRLASDDTAPTPPLVASGASSRRRIASRRALRGMGASERGQSTRALSGGAGGASGSGFVVGPARPGANSAVAAIGSGSGTSLVSASRRNLGATGLSSSSRVSPSAPDGFSAQGQLRVTGGSRGVRADAGAIAARRDARRQAASLRAITAKRRD